MILKLVKSRTFSFYNKSIGTFYRMCVFVCVAIPFILDVRLVDAPAGVTQEEGHTGFLIHLPSSVLPLIFIPRRIQPYLSLVDCEVEFCAPTNCHLFGACLYFKLLVTFGTTG